jgi:hypothetical protein
MLLVAEREREVMFMQVYVAAKKFQAAHLKNSLLIRSDSSESCIQFQFS